MTVENEIIRNANKLIRNKLENILIIKEQNSNLDEFKNILKKHNFNTKIINNNHLIFDNILENKDISLIFIDFELELKSLIDIIKYIKNKISIDAPILGLVKNFNVNDIQKAISYGMNDFMKLPLFDGEFNLRIDLWINHIINTRKIKQETKNISLLLNSTIEAIFMFENNYCIEINEEALNMFKFKNKNDFLHKHILDIVSTHISEYDKEQLLKNDVNHKFELEMINNEKVEFPALIKEKNIVLNNSNIKIIAVLDLTQIKKNEQMLVQQSKLASMGEMIGNIAHQWRQPLSSISIAASSIKVNYELDMVEEDELFEELDNIVKSTTFLSDTIDDFQSFIKGDAIVSNYNLSDVINKVLKLVEGNIKSANIDVIKELSDEINIFGLGNELVQAILNIVNNARDAIKEKDLEEKLIIINTSYDENKENVIINIQDNAQGIPKDILANIFDPYFTTKHQSQGTGLGLYMTHQMIIDHMNGKLIAKNNEFVYNSNNYKGALFTIILPTNK